MSDYRYEDPEPIKRALSCIDCHEVYLGTVGARNRCPGCKSLGGAPGTCPADGCQGGRDMHWSENERIAECPECDARYTVETLRTLELGRLVVALVRETERGSPEEVGRIILAQGRTSLRRVS